jgi:hypothetical protein
MEESIPRLGTEENRMKKISEKKNPAPVHRRDSMFCFLFRGTPEFRRNKPIVSSFPYSAE